MKLIYRLLFHFILFLLPLAVVIAEDIQVTSTFDKRAAAVNEEIHMTIRIAGAQVNLQAPHLPEIKNFDTFYTGRASHLTFINNQSSSSVEFSYVLVPKSSGKFTVPPIEVSVGGRQFRTDPIEITVSDASPVSSGQSPYQTPSTSRPSGWQTAMGGASQQTAPAAQSSSGAGAAGSSANIPQVQPPSFQPEDDNIFVNAVVDKTSVYPNEQVLLTYSLFTRYDTRYEGFEEEPQFSGFWIEEFPQEQDVPRETVRMNGKRYVKADIKKTALFPTAAAEYTINPGSLKVSIRKDPENTSMFDEFFNDSFFSGGDFFSRRENRLLKPPPIQVTVKPFPEKDKPKSFQGAVGDFRLTSTIDKQSVKQNEPATLKIVLEGNGNIETLNKPKISENPNLKTYDADTSFQLFNNGNIIGGKKTFEVVFIPLKAGQVKIPSLEFSYFNPRTQQYVVQRTLEYTLNVTPSDQPLQLPQALSGQELYKKDIEVQGKDIHYIQERLPDQKWDRVFTTGLRGLIALDAIFIIAALFGFFHSRQEKIFASDKFLRRRKFARSSAESRLKKLKALYGKQDQASNVAYFQEAEKILTQYLSDKFGLSAFGITRMDLERHLADTLGPHDPLNQQILELYRICDESRFAKASLPTELKDEVLKILNQTLARMEKMKK